MTIRRLIACILLPCQLLACWSWQAQEASPEQVIAEEHPDKMMVNLTDGSKVVLEQPTVSGDTLSGVQSGSTVNIPLSEVASVEIQKSSTSRTIVGIGLGVALVAVVVVVAGMIRYGQSVN